MRATLVVTAVLGAACSGSPVVTDAGVDAGPMGGNCSNITGDRKAQVCLRWSCDRMNVDEGVWTGDAGACEAGDVPYGRANALKLINLYRFLVELPAVETSATRDEGAQKCAVMMHAANALDHQPGTAWPCYSAAGATSAGNSNLSLTPAVAAVELYMEDPGNASTLGHRRWLLSTTLGPIGIGGTSRASCHHVTGGTTTTAKRFVAWPPNGPVPLAALTTTNVAATGWSVQSSDDLTGATVAVLEAGVDKPVDVRQLERDFGSRYAVSFTPRGWAPEAGHEYTVNVVAPAISANPIVYVVQPIACP